MIVKFPYALRDNEMIWIEDIKEVERGAKCRCICPKCKEDLLAKLGVVRIPHFAHSNKTKCNQEIAYIFSIYKMMEQLLNEEKYIVLPGIFYGFNCEPSQIEYSWEIKFTSNLNDISSRKHKKELVKERKVEVISTEVVEVNSAQEMALLLNIENKKLAIKITPNKKSCRVRKVYPYEHSDATIGFELDDTSFDPKTLKSIFIDTSTKKTWLDNKKIQRKIQELKDEGNKLRNKIQTDKKIQKKI